MSSPARAIDLQRGGRSRTENEDLVVELALNYMCARGWIDPECVDDQLEQALRRLYRADETGFIRTRQPIKFTGEVLHDLCAARPGECLAHAWECEQIEAYERALPVWRCDCGSEFKVAPHPWQATRANDRFYRAAEDGTLGALVGTIRGKGSGPDANDRCPAVGGGSP